MRNLYERTADVGFLATDDEVRRYCAADAAGREAQRPAMRRRLQEYRAKYSVYDDIALLGPRGEVGLRLDDRAGLELSQDPIVGQALAAEGWVEAFGSSDLAEGDAPALRYAHRIADDAGRPLGVLVLRFRFADEMRHIFANVADEHRQIALVLLDDAQRVIASNDPAHIPLGARLGAIDDRGVALTFFGGREYLAVRCPTRGYQGYQGPGWRAQAMVSLLTAFRGRQDEGADTDDVPLDQAELLAIHRDADAINRDLRRVVWNGRLMTDTRASERRRVQAVLTQVNRAGARTRARVEDAIRDLYRTSLSRARNQAQELASLAADIMDRNLYERANDCRWWALSPAIQRALEQPQSAAAPRLNAVLDHINGLYTVYSRIVVFDAEGRIRGASHAGEAAGLIGSAIDPEYLRIVATLGDSQRYAVSPYADTPLHAHGETYVYLAAIRSPADARRLLGGIAIVFHAAREFSAMLQDLLGERVGFAGFVEAEGRVLAATDAALTAGACRLVPGTAAGGASGTPGALGSIVEIDGVHYACVRTRAQGYREFKTSDGYDNHVEAVVGLRLGAANRRRQSLGDVGLEPQQDSRAARSQELAVFQVGAMRYALPAEAVLEAVSTQGLVRTPGAAGRTLGLLEVEHAGRSRLVPVVCARRQFDVRHPARASDGIVIVLRSPQCPELPAMGLRVDDVITVLDAPEPRLHPVPEGFPRHSPWVERLFDAQTQGGAGRSVLVQVLAAARIVADVLATSMSAAATTDRGDGATRAEPAPEPAAVGAALVQGRDRVEG